MTQRNWRYRATRCAVIGCANTRKRGWSTCQPHYVLGKMLAGAGRIEPINLHVNERGEHDSQEARRRQMERGY